MKLYNVSFLSDLKIEENVILAFLYYKRESLGTINATSISKSLNISVRTYQRIINNLIDKGYLQRFTIGKKQGKIIYSKCLTKKTYDAYTYVLEKKSKRHEENEKTIQGIENLLKGVIKK